MADPTLADLVTAQRGGASGPITGGAPDGSVGRGPVLDFGQGVFRGVSNLGPVAADVASIAGVGPGGDTMRAAMGSPALSRPDTFAGRTGERFGAGVPFLAAGGGLGSARAVAAMVASEVAASGAGQFVEDQGGSGTAQFLTEIGVGIANPGSQLGKFAPSAATRTNRKIKALANRLGVSEKAILRAGDFHRKTDIKINPLTGEPDVASTVNSFQEAVDLFPDRRVRPSSRQSTGKDTVAGLTDGEPGLAFRENAMARSDSGFRNLLAGRKDAVLSSIEADFDAIRPNGSIEVVTNTFEVAQEVSDRSASGLWDLVDLNSMPQIDTAPLKEAANEVIRRVGKDHPEFIPDEARKILAMPDTIPASRLQTFRSGMLRNFRLSSRGTAETAATARAEHMGPILGAFQKAVDELPEGGSRAYREARDATRRHYELFDGRSVAVAALNSMSEGRAIARRLRGSKRPAQEAERVLRIMEQSPGGADSFRRVLIDELTDEGLGNKSVGQMTRELRQHSKFYRTAFGEEKYGQMRDVLRKLRMAQTGSAATTAAAEKTGSGLNSVSGAIRGLQALMGSGHAAGEAVQAVAHAGAYIDQLMLNRDVMKEFMLDPESGIIILQAPDPKTLPVWTATFDMIVARALSRRALSIEGAAAARSFTPDQRQFEAQQ